MVLIRGILLCTKEKTRKGEESDLLRSIESTRDLLLFWRV